jgi:hypothetical protein
MYKEGFNSIMWAGDGGKLVIVISRRKMEIKKKI